MTENCPVRTPAERELNDLLTRVEATMMATVYKAIEEATQQAAEEMQAIGSTETPPPYKYYIKAVHHHMFCVLCDADPHTMQGGDAEIAALILDSGKRISAYYWEGRDETKPQDSQSD